ncbi:MAG: outer membrane lipoprotein-sorting protein [Deltaproteobacteria bacterium]|nr:outer membrane lipoprotein-sorting protein [Deltaproteobacteria bacterium]
MKKTIFKTGRLLTVLLTLLISCFALGDGVSVKDILQKVDDGGYSKSSKIYMTQTVITPSGDKREFKMVAYSKNGNQQALTQYLAPQQVAGMKILTLNDGDDIWSYFPRTNRTRKIASSARNRKVQGSDFTYEDMAQGKMVKAWTGTMKGSEKLNNNECYKLELTPTSAGPRSYKKAEMFVDKKNFIIHKAIYFDSYGEKFKELVFDDYKKVSGVWVPYKYIMTNLQDGGKTVVTVANAEININLENSLFSESSLGS